MFDEVDESSGVALKQQARVPYVEVACWYHGDVERTTTPYVSYDSKELRHGFHTCTPVLAVSKSWHVSLPHLTGHTADVRLKFVSTQTSRSSEHVELRAAGCMAVCYARWVPTWPLRKA